MYPPILHHKQLEKALAIRDLTDPQQGPHGLQILVHELHESLAKAWSCQRLVYRGSRIVTVQSNYDDLAYPPHSEYREPTYSQYVTHESMLRTHTSAAVPGLLQALAYDCPRDLLLACPGLVYRLDSSDSLHVPEPHQIDLWRLSTQDMRLTHLEDMIAMVMATVLPGRSYRTVESQHPYTLYGQQIDVASEGTWIEIGECGLINPMILIECGHPPARASGLAMGLGLDRIMMLRKGIPDIRLLRSITPGIREQMLDLKPYIENRERCGQALRSGV
jgi:phenylalanyl-tRNA synthetase alpha chain